MAWKKFVYEIKPLKTRRQQLRHDTTLAEKILWEKLRNRKIGLKFIRQYSVSGYVLDFYCPEKRVGIELEGEIHQQKEVKIYDDFRFRYLQALDIKIIRIKNEEIFANIQNVVSKLAISLS